MDQPRKTGFSLGVVIGAVLGTGAYIMSRSSEGKALQERIGEKITQLKVDFPEEAGKVEDLITAAVAEAKNVTRQLSGVPSKDLGTSRTSAKKAKPPSTEQQQRAFTKGGKKLQ